MVTVPSPGIRPVSLLLGSAVGHGPDRHQAAALLLQLRHHVAGPGEPRVPALEAGFTGGELLVVSFIVVSSSDVWPGDCSSDHRAGSFSVTITSSQCFEDLIRPALDGRGPIGIVPLSRLDLILVAGDDPLGILDAGGRPDPAL